MVSSDDAAVLLAEVTVVSVGSAADAAEVGTGIVGMAVTSSVVSPHEQNNIIQESTAGNKIVFVLMVVHLESCILYHI